MTNAAALMASLALALQVATIVAVSHVPSQCAASAAGYYVGNLAR